MRATFLPFNSQPPEVAAGPLVHPWVAEVEILPVITREMMYNSQGKTFVGIRLFSVQDTAYHFCADTKGGSSGLCFGIGGNGGDVFTGNRG